MNGGSEGKEEAAGPSPLSPSPARAPFARDEPVDLDHDVLGHADYTRALASMAGDDDVPSTVGIFGPWGVGKSTIVEALPQELPNGTAYVYFDAWKYEGDVLRRQFLRDCASQLEQASALSGFTVEKDLQELDVDRQEANEGLGLSWRRGAKALIYGAVIGTVVFLLLEIGAVADFIKTDKLGQRVVIAAGAVVLATLLQLLSQVVVITETTVTRRQLQDPDRFADRFAALLQATKLERVVIVIDNLDRCAPDRAVEMLSTIKTYLEPTLRRDRPPPSPSQKTVDKDVMFVVSVDDEALRRHLLAQEMQRAQSTTDLDEARKYVDEYLAKFFSVRLPIRPILPDDIRDYIEQNLEPLIEARGFQNKRKALTELVSVGLRRNPRRVKQFVNDLEIRLRLLQQRETERDGKKPGISPPVSQEILMIAKLALLESEFPRAFERLEQRRRQLDDWHAEADSNTEVWIDGKPEDEAEAERQRPRAQAFATFLQASRSIETVHLRALLDLKQVAGEAGLPGFAEFRAAVTGDNQPAVQQLLADATPEELRGYASRMPQILQEELSQRYISSARAVVRTMIAVEAFAEFTDERTEVLNIALSDQELRDNELVYLDPGALLEAGRGLSEPRQRELISPVVTRLIGEGKADEERSGAGAALAPFVTVMKAEDRERIKAALDGDLRQNFDAYVRLAEADPELLPVGIAQVAIEELNKPDEHGRRSLVGKEAALGVALVALPHEQDSQVDEMAIELTLQALDATAEDPSTFEGNVATAIKMLSVLNAATPEQWERLARHVQSQWPNYPREADELSLDLVQLVLGQMDEAPRTEVAGLVAPVLFQPDPSHGVELLDRVKDSLIDELKEPIVTQLVGIGAEHTHLRTTTGALVRELAGADAGPRLRQMLIPAVQRGDVESAIELLEDHRDVLGPEVEGITDELLTWADGLGASGGRIPYEIFGELERHGGMDDARRERLSNLLLPRLWSGDADATAALDTWAADGPRALGEAALLGAINTLTGSASPEGNMSTLLGSIAPRLNLADEEDQVRLGDKLSEWLDQRHLRSQLAAHIKQFRGLRARAAEPIVEKLLEAAGQEAQELGVELLLAADHIRGGSQTRATRRFDDYLTELTDGSEQQKSLAAAFEATRAG